MNECYYDTIFQISTKWLFNTFFHQCVAIVFVYAIWIPIENYSNPFSWHVILCTLGVLPVMFEALTLFSNDNLWKLEKKEEISRKKKAWMHGILISLGSFFVIIGTVIEIIRRLPFDAPHFTSAHSITGLVAVILIILAMVCGLMAYYTAVLSKWIPPVWLKLVHNIVGQLAFILTIVCLCLGFYTRWFSYYTSETSRATATIVTVLIIIWSLFYACKSLFSQIKSVCE